MTNNPKELKGWHVLTIILIVFGVVFAVNGFFIYKAYSTYSGEKEHAYMEGLKFNETLAARAVQSELGWKMSLDMNRGAGGDALFVASFKDKNNEPVKGLNIIGKIGRKTEDKEDMNLIFKETKTGIYEAHVKELASGKWVFNAKASKINFPDFITETELKIR